MPKHRRTEPQPRARIGPLDLQNMEVSVPTADYAEMMAGVMMMKPNKCKHYKAFLKDKWGGNSRVRYIDGQLMNYNLIAKRFVPVTPYSELAGSMSISKVGRAVRAIEALSVDDSIKRCLCAAIMNEEVKSNYTGNHVRHKHVTIRTDRKSSDAF